VAGTDLEKPSNPGRRILIGWTEKDIGELLTGGTNSGEGGIVGQR
jgi:hypothetical protein